MPTVQGSGGKGVNGEICVADGSTVQSVATGAGGEKISGFAENGAANGTTPDHTNDQITLPNAGLYLVLFTCSFGGGVGNNTWQAHLHDAGGEIAIAAAQRRTTNNDTGSMAFTGLYQAAAGAVLTVFIEHDQGGNEDFTPVDMCLTVVRQDGSG